jgi:uncharacterized 2Fe-2S/4Fe-4S cluster protein (DUF4445 family)
MTTEHTVDLEPVGRRAHVASDATLLDAARSAGVELVAVCGGIGICSGCRVRCVAGQLTPPTLEEEAEYSPDDLRAGWRLACQARPLGDVRLDIPPDSLTTPQRLQVEGEALAVALDPVVTVLDVTLPPADLHDLRADERRLRDAFPEIDLTIGTAALGDLARVLRAHGWSARLALRRGGQVAAALPPGTALLGLAVDIGTTGLAAYLIDLATGDTLARAGAMNPQIAYGEDVISRIVYANDHADGARQLQARLIATLNELVTGLCAGTGTDPAHIVEAVWVGNTVMHHLALGLPVRQLGEAPYVPVIDRAVEIRAADVGLATAPDARIYLPPNIAGYVGADHMAMLLASGAAESGQTTLAVDIGTNTEMTLAHAGRLVSCSCASGPAFEGAHIRHGMRAAPGAVERVQILDGAVHVQTIGGGRATGICGSGILDAVAVMTAHGIVNSRGVLDAAHPLVRDGAFLLALSGDAHAAVTVDRKDVAEIQLAKAAIRAGIDLLLREVGLDADALEAFVIAGAFGSYIQVESAVRIGMFPALPRDRFTQIGNAAGMGACRLLVSGALRDRADALARTIDYIELTTVPDFQDVFIERMALTGG